MRAVLAITKRRIPRAHPAPDQYTREARAAFVMREGRKCANNNSNDLYGQTNHLGKTVVRLLLLLVPIFKYVTKHVIASSRPRFTVKVKIMALVSNSRFLGLLTGA